MPLTNHLGTWTIFNEIFFLWPSAVLRSLALPTHYPSGENFLCGLCLFFSCQPSFYWSTAILRPEWKWDRKNKETRVKVKYLLRVFFFRLLKKPQFCHWKYLLVCGFNTISNIYRPWFINELWWSWLFIYIFVSLQLTLTQLELSSLSHTLQTVSSDIQYYGLGCGR